MLFKRPTMTFETITENALGTITGGAGEAPQQVTWGNSAYVEGIDWSGKSMHGKWRGPDGQWNTIPGETGRWRENNDGGLFRRPTYHWAPDSSRIISTAITG